MYVLPQNALRMQHFDANFSKNFPGPHLGEGVTPTPTPFRRYTPQWSLRLHWSLVPPAVEVLDPPLSPLRFQRLVISCFQVAIWLKYRWSDVNPQNNQQPIRSSLVTRSWIGVMSDRWRVCVGVCRGLLWWIYSHALHTVWQNHSIAGFSISS